MVGIGLRIEYLLWCSDALRDLDAELNVAQEVQGEELDTAVLDGARQTEFKIGQYGVGIEFGRGGGGGGHNEGGGGEGEERQGGSVKEEGRGRVGGEV